METILIMEVRSAGSFITALFNGRELSISDKPLGLYVLTYASWFQILTDSDMYWQYIGYWGTHYDIDLIMSADIEADIADIFDIDGRYLRYW